MTDMTNVNVTWEFLNTPLGAISTAWIIVQFTKDIPGIRKIPTRYWTFIVTTIIVVLAALAVGEFEYKNVFLLFVKSIIHTFSATGGYDFTVKLVRAKFDKGDIETNIDLNKYDKNIDA